MAGSLSDVWEKKVSDLVFGGVSITPVTTLYFALLTDSSTDTQRDAGTLTEVGTGTWTNYARVAVTNNQTNFPAATGVTAAKSNAVAITWPAATTTGNVTVTGFAIYDASTAGVQIWAGSLSASQTVANLNTFSFAIGALNFTTD